MLALAGLGTLTLAAAAAAQAPAGEIQATETNDRFENVFETADGSIYATATFGNKVIHRTRNGMTSVFFSAANPQGVIQTPKGMVVDYQDRLPDFSTGRLVLAGLGAHLVVLNHDGKVVKSLEGPDEKAFFNGMAAYGRNAVFISDTGGDRILKANLDTGKVTIWLDSDKTHDAAAGPGFPNGMKVHDGWVYFSRGDIYRIKIGRDGKPQGVVVLAAKTGGTDDFDVAADGTIYASHGADIVKVTPSGESSVFLAGGCPFCTATRVSRDGRQLYFTGGSVRGRPGPAVAGFVSRVALPR